jgi:hypothetical protein
LRNQKHCDSRFLPTTLLLSPLSPQPSPITARSGERGKITRRAAAGRDESRAAKARARDDDGAATSDKRTEQARNNNLVLSLNCACLLKQYTELIKNAPCSRKSFDQCKSPRPRGLAVWPSELPSKFFGSADGSSEYCPKLACFSH